MASCKFDQISAELRIEMKENNTIVEHWPTQLKLKSSEEGTEKEFRLLLGSSFPRMERYVEWRRLE